MIKEKCIMDEADKLILQLERRDLGWSLNHIGNFIECRIWEWPTLVGRYRSDKVEPLAKMLAEAIEQMEQSTRKSRG